MNDLIRPLTQEDEPFLWEMLYEAAHLAEEGETSVQAAIEHPDISKYVKNWGRLGDLGFVAVAPDGAKIGAAWLRLFPADDGGYGYVDDRTPELAIAVRPQDRNRGVGTQLLSHLLEAAKVVYPAVSLSVRDSNSAVRLYRKLGFKLLDDSETVNRTGGRSFSMKIDFII